MASMTIIRDGVVLAIYLFIIFTIYIFTSAPFHDITSEFAGLDAASDTETVNTLTMIDTVYAMVFVLLMGVPSFWFIMRVFQRDPYWGYQQ